MTQPTALPAGANGRPAVRRKGFFRRNLSRIFLAGLVLSGGAFFAATKMRPVAVVATPVVRGQAVDAVYATGTVEAEDRVQVKAKTAGSLSEVLVKEGDRVKKGDLIARIDSPQLNFELARGKVDLGAAAAQGGKAAPQVEALKAQALGIQADLSLARQDLDRQLKLAATGAVSSADTDRAKAKVAQLEATLAANEAQQKALRIDLSANAARQAAQVKTLESRVADTEVRAPIDGVVLSKSVDPGEVVSVNQNLFKIGDTARLILEVSVDEADISRVKEPEGAGPGSRVAVSLYAFPNDVLAGRVFEILPDANRERKSFLAKVRLDKPPPGLRSGMSGEVNILIGVKDNALLAPSQAEADGSVWVVDGGKARKTPVKVGIRDLLRVEITEGVSEGALLLVEGQDKVTDGTRLSVTTREQDRLAPVPEANGVAPSSAK